MSFSSIKVGVSQHGTTSNTSVQDTSIPKHSYELEVTPASVKGENSQLFTQVAWLDGKEGRTIHLQNRMFQERCPIQGLHTVGTADSQQGEFQRLYSLQKVTHVALKIVKLSGSCVPAVGKVEIWGQPSASCKPEMLEYALGIQGRIQGGQKIKTAITGEIHNGTVESSKHHNVLPGANGSSSSIPEDFVDPITCEIMIVPLLLPSGHNIDTSTLEKHITAERSWGRLPSDPFTGKIFSDTCKPVPNSALKVRIDKFLLTSGVNTSGYGRTVGRDSDLVRQSNQNNSSLLKMDHNVSVKDSYKTVNHGRRELTSTERLSDAKCEQRVLNAHLLTSEQTGKVTQYFTKTNCEDNLHKQSLSL